MRKFKNEHVGADNNVLLNSVEYDQNQNVIAGILGGTYWGWLHIDILWVDEKFRRKKIGSRLLIAAENEAKKRGFSTLYLKTDRLASLLHPLSSLPSNTTLPIL